MYMMLIYQHFHFQQVVSYILRDRQHRNTPSKKVHFHYNAILTSYSADQESNSGSYSWTSHQTVSVGVSDKGALSLACMTNPV